MSLRGRIDAAVLGKPALLTLLAAPMLVALCAGPAQACSVLSPRLEREAAEAREDTLADADKVVTGEWAFDPTDRGNEGLRWGTVTTPANGKRTPRTYRVLTRQELSCGFPVYPSDDETGQPQWGRFYLKRERGTAYFTLIHFDSIERPK